MLAAKVTALDSEGRVIETDYAYGNTKRTVEAAAEGLRRQMENEHPDSTVNVAKAKKS